jgi:hypothetical protein
MVYLLCQDNPNVCWIALSWPPLLLLLLIFTFLISFINSKPTRVVSSDLPLYRIRIISYVLISLQITLFVYQLVSTHDTSEAEIYVSLLWIPTWLMQIVLCTRLWQAQGKFSHWVHCFWIAAWIYHAIALAVRSSNPFLQKGSAT